MNAGSGSLRRRLTAAIVGITAGVVLVAAAGLWLATRAILQNELDRQLTSRIERVRRIDPARPPMWWRRGEGRPGESRPAEPREREGEPQRFLRVVDAEGRETARSPGLPEGTDFTATVHDRPYDVVLGDGRHVRAMAVRIERDGASGVAWLAVDREPLDQELARMAGVLSALWLAATVLAWIAAMACRSAVLRPLAGLGAAIDGIGPDDLSARVPATAGPREMHGIVARVNGLLDRLERAFASEQATIANLAHELRTPVAALRTAIEFRQLAASDPAEVRTLASCHRTIERMQAVVGDLLLLARLEAGRETLARESVDAVAVVRETLDGWRERALARGQELTLAAPATLPLATSPGHLRLAVGNLVGNAVAHGSEGATVAVALAVEDGRLVLRLANPFSGALDPAALGAGFYRGDAARSGQHAGLGLALATRLARLLGGDLSVAATDGRFTATLRLPMTGE